jgi:hypothetical protein
MSATCSLLAASLLVATAAAADAEILLTPYYGAAFGGTTTETSPTYGGAVGFMAGGWLGAEAEYGYVKDFFGSSSAGAGLSQNKVQSASGSLLLGVNLGPLRPYGAVGLSLIGANLASRPGLAALDDTAAGYDAGGGVFIWLGKHVGLRGDARYFRTFEAVGTQSALGIERLDFWRGTGGLTLRF